MLTYTNVNTYIYASILINACSYVHIHAYMLTNTHAYARRTITSSVTCS